jgi:hypothetical protein
MAPPDTGVSNMRIALTVSAGQNLRMKTAHGLVLAALLSTMAGCATPAAGDANASSSDQALAATPGLRGTEMWISFPARQELADALAPTQPEEHGFMDVIVPDVLRIQHQFSIAALRLEAASWTLVTDLPVDDSPWSIHSSLGVAFPREVSSSTRADKTASEAAAEKLFDALVRATETTAEKVSGVQETTRASARKTFSCTKTTEANRPARFQCTIAGVSSVGGTGLLWGEN